MRRKTLVAQHLIEGQFPVLWYVSRTKHYIIYGAQVNETENGMEAARLFGYAVHHQAECEGRLS